MNQQDTGKSGTTSTSSGGGSSSGASRQDVGKMAQDVGKVAKEKMGKLGDAAQELGSQAKQAATSLAAEAHENIKGALNQKVGVGAELVGHVAESVRAAADNLKQNSPQLAGLVSVAADKIDELSDSVRDKSVDDLFESATDFARRQPAVVFGAAAAVGFLLFRILKVAPKSTTQNTYAGGEFEGRYRGPTGRQEFGRQEFGRPNGQSANGRSGQSMGQRHGV